MAYFVPDERVVSVRSIPGMLLGSGATIIRRDEVTGRYFVRWAGGNAGWYDEGVFERAPGQRRTSYQIRVSAHRGREGFLIVGKGARVFLKTRTGAERYRELLRDVDSGKLTRQEMWGLERGVFDADTAAAEGEVRGGSKDDSALQARISALVGKK